MIESVMISNDRNSEKNCRNIHLFKVNQFLNLWTKNRCLIKNENFGKKILETFLKRTCKT